MFKFLIFFKFQINWIGQILKFQLMAKKKPSVMTLGFYKILEKSKLSLFILENYSQQVPLT